MVRYLLIILTLINILISNICFAYSNEPNGFRNMIWGDNLQKLVDQYGGYVEYDKATSLDKINEKTYISYTTDPYVSNIKIDNDIRYEFFNDQFYSVSFKSSYSNLSDLEKNFKSLYSKMEIIYGKADMSIPTLYNDFKSISSYYWVGSYNGVNIDLTIYPFPEVSKYVLSVTITYRPIQRNINKIFKEYVENEAKKGW